MRRLAALAVVLLVLSGCKDPSPTAPTPVPAATSEPVAAATDAPIATQAPIVGLLAPFASGLTATVGHGYNDPPPTTTCTIPGSPDHCLNQRDGLDFDMTGTDRRILAPVDGTVTELTKPGKNSTVGGCIRLETGDGLNINLCHASSLIVAVGQPVERGCVLAERDSSWIHISIDDRRGGARPYPAIAFTGDHRLEGVEYPDSGDGDSNQHRGKAITSTNEAKDCPRAGSTGTVTAAWASPAADATIKDPKLKLAATVAGPPITSVTFRATWADQKGVACTASAADATGRWSCVANLQDLGVRPGPLQLTFDVQPAVGTPARAAGGTRKATYAPVYHWTDPERVFASKGCSSVAAGIDADGRVHLVAGCDEQVWYAVRKGRGAWAATLLQGPKNRPETDPRIGFLGGTIVVAYTRNPPPGGCGDMDVPGVYTRRSSGGGWSDAVAIGEAWDTLGAFRVANGSLYAIISPVDEGRPRLEIVRGGSDRRVTLPEGGAYALRIGADGAPRIAYANEGGIRYGKLAGSSFSTVAVDGSRSGDQAPELVLDEKGRAHLAWFHPPTNWGSGGCAEPEIFPTKRDGTYVATEQGGAFTTRRITTDYGAVALAVDGASRLGRVLVVGEGGKLRLYEEAADGRWDGSTLDAGEWIGSPVLLIRQTTGATVAAYVKDGKVYVRIRG